MIFEFRQEPMTFVIGSCQGIRERSGAAKAAPIQSQTGGVSSERMERVVATKFGPWSFERARL